MDDSLELTALRTALRMMGLDPRKVAQYIADDADHACKAVLFRCVAVDEARLRAEAGERTPIAGWKSLWSQLRFSPPVTEHGRIETTP